jgi:hypothetical protein
LSSGDRKMLVRGRWRITVLLVFVLTTGALRGALWSKGSSGELPVIRERDRVGATSGSDAGPLPDGAIVWLDDAALAERLAYCLWQEPPDEELRTLATRRQLHHPDVLRAQAARLLQDRKAQRFAQAFLARWLGLGGAGSEGRLTSPSPPAVDSALEAAPVGFIALLRANRSVNALLVCDSPVLRLAVAARLSTLIDDVPGPGVQSTGRRQEPAERLAWDFAAHLAAFAAGRPLRATDGAAVTDVVARGRIDGFGLGTILHEIVQSEPFQCR